MGNCLQFIVDGLQSFLDDEHESTARLAANFFDLTFLHGVTDGPRLSIVAAVGKKL
jgi:hypothetical protein